MSRDRQPQPPPKPKRELEFCMVDATMPFATVARKITPRLSVQSSVMTATLNEVLVVLHKDGWVPMVALGDTTLIFKREKE